jgi:regulator of RNase E activity RraB
METIPNDETGAALKQFIRAGSDLTKKMAIDFFVAVPSKEQGNEIALQVDKLGFKTNVEFDIEADDWTCYCTKVLVPDYSEIIKIEKQLSSIAKHHGGYLDGFGSFGNAGV